MPPAWASIAVAATFIACTVMAPAAFYQPEYNRAATAIGVGIPLCALAYGLIVYAFIWHPLRSMAEDVRNSVPPPETLCTSDVRRMQAAMRVVVTRIMTLRTRVYHSEVCQLASNGAIPIPMLRLDPPVINPMRRVEQLPESRASSPNRLGYYPQPLPPPTVGPGKGESTPSAAGAAARAASQAKAPSEDLQLRDPFELEPAVVAVGAVGSGSSSAMFKAATSEYVALKPNAADADADADELNASLEHAGSSMGEGGTSVFKRELTDTSGAFYSCGPTPCERDD